MTVPAQVDGCTILLVEDESLVSLLAEDVLTEAGFHVLLATCLAKGLEIAEREVFDMAVLDVNLGGGDTSYPIASTLKCRGIPFVFVTGYGADGLEPGYRDQAVVQKPYDPTELVKIAAKLIRLV